MLFSTKLKTVILMGLTATLLAACSSEDSSDETGNGIAGEPLAPLLEGIGDYHFDIHSESELTGKYFDQGMTFIWAFNHEEAERSFQEAARQDPDCAICFWGIAYALGPNYNAPMAEENISPAWEAAAHALNIGHFGGVKEQGLMSAIMSRYSRDPAADRSTLDRAYADAMRSLRANNPEDADIAVLYAEALMDLSPWELYDLDGNPNEGTDLILASLESALAIDPNHIGALHYYIHALEPSNEPEKALEAADKLGGLVPVSGHLVHMPSHIYVRMGDYFNAVAANEAAIKADDLYVNQCLVQGFSADPYYPHNLHFLWYAAMEGGNREQALISAEELFDTNEGSMYSGIPVLTHLRFGQWQQALDRAIQIETSTPDRLDDEAKITHSFGQSIAHSKLGQLEQAAAQLQILESLLTGEELNTTVNQIYREVAAAVLAGEQGDLAGKITGLEQAVSLQDELTYFEPPTFYFPVRQALGAALVDAGRLDEAGAVFRTDLLKNPNNPWSVYGVNQVAIAKDNAIQIMALSRRVTEVMKYVSFEMERASYF